MFDKNKKELCRNMSLYWLCCPRKWNTIWEAGILWHGVESEMENNNVAFAFMVTVSFQMATPTFIR